VLVARYLTIVGDFERALSVIATAGTKYATFQLEARTDLVAAAGDWERVPEIIAELRHRAAIGDLEGLPAYADRLEGRQAVVGGDAATAEIRLRSAAETFGRLGASWERAVTNLDLGELLVGSGRAHEADPILRAALAEFRRLRSVREADRAARWLGKVRAD
jgi:hypothetical protein